MIVFPLIGIPIGITLTSSNRAIGDHGNPNYAGVLMVVAIAGNTFGAMVLPQVFEYLLNQEYFSVQLLYFVISGVMGMLIFVGIVIPESKNINDQDFSKKVRIFLAMLEIFSFCKIFLAKLKFSGKAEIFLAKLETFLLC